MASAQLPTVAILGRPNVGKSALFNRLAKLQIAIVHEQAGVTRDRLCAECRLGTAPFYILDTGGICSDVDQHFNDIVNRQADIAIEAADLILFVTDGAQGITALDEVVAERLRRSEHPVFLIVNKIDHPNHEDLETDFLKLGFKTLLPISAAHGRGIQTLVEHIESTLAHSQARLAHVEPGENAELGEPCRAVSIAIVGRPNVGKSSLINAIVQDNRTIVSEIAGTTRDAVDISYTYQDKPYVLIDTAGIRPRNRRKTSVEVFSVMRAERSIRRADLCLLLLDAEQGPTAQDQKIASIIKEAEKPCLIVCNKLDLIQPAKGGFRETLSELQEKVSAELHFIDYAPIIALSALKQQRIQQCFKEIERICKEAQQKIGTGILNRMFQEILELNPPPFTGKKRFKLLYATQVDELKHRRAIEPPTLMLFVNDPKLISDPYRRYLEKQVRARYPFLGLPILFRMRGREKRT